MRYGRGRSEDSLAARCPNVVRGAAVRGLVGAGALLVSLALAQSAQATTFTVTGTADGTSACAGLQCPSLRSAVLASNAAGGTNTIKLPAGQFKLTLTPTSPDDATTGDLNITTSVTIQGHGDGAAGTRIVGDTDRIFDISDGVSKVTLTGLMLTGGSDEVFGGAIQADGDKLTLLRDAFISNATATDGFGGAIYAAPTGAATLIVTNSVFRSNTAAETGSGNGFGGAISFQPGSASTMTVTNSEFDSNTAQSGASSGGGFGGAIDFEPGDTSKLTITGSTFAANTAQGSTTQGAFGGGLEFGPGNAATLTITNTTFSGDKATGPGSFGGGIDYEPGTGSHATLTQVTIAGNSVATAHEGGGIEVAAPMTIRNSIVSGNAAAGAVNNCTVGGGSIARQGHSVELGKTCGFDINANPLLRPLGTYGGLTKTRALAATSPARDHAASAFCPATDQRGVHRPDDPGTPCDIGAFEFARPLIVITTPANGARLKRGSHVVAAFRCTEGGVSSPIASCQGTVPNGHPINTATAGTHSFTVSATDRTGQHIAKTVHYTVTN